MYSIKLDLLHDVVLYFQKKKAHEDSITWIEIMVDQNAFATSSFDCQVHLWSITTFEKIGSLILGHESLNNNWQFRINEEERKQQEYLQLAENAGHHK